MTSEEIYEIYTLKIKGYGYKKISSITGLSLNNVKSYLHRHPEPPSEFLCKNCGELLHPKSPKRAKKFCNDTCRMEWWKRNQDLINHTKNYSHTCENCGASFYSLRASTRFCNRKCYADFRRKGEKQ